MKKGDVCLVRLPAGVRHEQYGERPAIVLAQPTVKLVVVIPLTTNLEALRFPHTLTIEPTATNGLHQKSVALILHIRAIDVVRVVHVIGSVDAKTQRRVDAALKAMLKL